jgi:putative addiction module component (TIGR02574 family)
MSVEQIAAEALRLPENERAGLASRLLRSLPPVAFDDDEGVAEALRRDAELDADPTRAMTLNDLDSHTKFRKK